MLEVQHALCTFTEVYASLWPLDPTPRLLTRLFIEYEYGAAYRDSEKERCRYVTAVAAHNHSLSTVCSRLFLRH